MATLQEPKMSGDNDRKCKWKMITGNGRFRVLEQQNNYSSGTRLKHRPGSRRR